MNLQFASFVDLVHYTISKALNKKRKNITFSSCTSRNDKCKKNEGGGIEVLCFLNCQLPRWYILYMGFTRSLPRPTWRKKTCSSNSHTSRGFQQSSSRRTNGSHSFGKHRPMQASEQESPWENFQRWNLLTMAGSEQNSSSTSSNTLLCSVTMRSG